MSKQIVGGALFLALVIAQGAQSQSTDGFSWKMGPVDVNAGRTAKLIFANPFCPNPLMKMDVTVAITDLSGQIVQMRTPGSQPVPARKRARRFNSRSTANTFPRTARSSAYWK